MRVALFVTCLVDQLWPSVGTATVRVLERAGCEVLFDERQTCCGQPAFNSGYRAEARSVARAFLEVYGRDDAEALVLPSGSCAAMVDHMAELFDESDPLHERAKAVAAHNVVARDLAKAHAHVHLVDQAQEMPQQGKLFNDICHLSDAGSVRFVANLVRGIKNSKLGPE